MIADQILLIHNLIPKSVQFVFHIEGISNIPYYVLQYLPCVFCFEFDVCTREILMFTNLHYIKTSPEIASRLFPLKAYDISLWVT